ncbi:PucR family transcriptional regulator [Rhodococcus sp. NPDC058532]|uniref:PucR family transcriptional regulator n=1 Tax=Rhodococcus sp. NPDC058532 TaxID=3346540 RepID=UPI00365B4009
METPSTAQAGEWMRSYVADTLSRTDLASFIDGVAQSMGADVPELSTDAEIQRDLHWAVRSQFRLILAAQTSDASPRWSVPVAPEAHSLARTIARRGLELRVLSQLYHAGHRAVWRFVTEFVHRADVSAEFKVQLVVMMWEQTSEVMNAMLEDLAATYTQERERLLSGAFSMRVNTIREILDGTQNSAADASALLGYPLHRVHTALVLWTTDHAASLDSRIFEPLASRLARSASATEIICVPSGARGLWAWMVTGDVDPVLDSSLVVPGVRVAMGRPGSGLDGFRRTHREAQAAQDLAARSRGRVPVTDYRDVELISMLSARPDAMSALVDRELAGLLGEDEVAARLRETLRAVLSHQGNLEATARHLTVHKNTVRYRVQQIEERLGRRITHRALHLELALDCYDAFGAHAPAVSTDQFTGGRVDG